MTASIAREQGAGRSRGTLLRHARRADAGGVPQTIWPPTNPRRFKRKFSLMHRVVFSLFVSLVIAGVSGGPASAQSFQDIGRALDALAGPAPQRPAARPHPVPAQPRSGDRCASYASTMVQQNQQARQMRCQNWNSHSNYDHHYSWCQARPPQAAQTALASWGTRFQTCQFAASGSPAARAQTARPAAGSNGHRQPVCSSFGNAAANWERRASSQGCDIRGAAGIALFGSASRATTWCMRTSESDFQGRSPQAAGHKDALERHCSAQLRRPIRL